MKRVSKGCHLNISIPDMAKVQQQILDRNDLKQTDLHVIDMGDLPDMTFVYLVDKLQLEDSARISGFPLKFILAIFNSVKTNQDVNFLHKAFTSTSDNTLRFIAQKNLIQIDYTRGLQHWRSLYPRRDYGGDYYGSKLDSAHGEARLTGVDGVVYDFERNYQEIQPKKAYGSITILKVLNEPRVLSRRFSEIFALFLESKKYKPSIWDIYDFQKINLGKLAVRIDSVIFKRNAGKSFLAVGSIIALTQQMLAGNFFTDGEKISSSTMEFALGTASALLMACGYQLEHQARNQEELEMRQNIMKINPK